MILPNAKTKKTSASIALYQPVLRAYSIAFLLTTVTQVGTIVPSLLKGGDARSKLRVRLTNIVCRTIQLDSLPTLAALLIFASSAFPRIVSGRQTPKHSLHAVRFASVFIAANVAFRLLDRSPTPEPSPRVEISVPGKKSVVVAREARSVVEHATTSEQRGGKTLFTTSFAVINAGLALISILSKGRQPKGAARFIQSPETMFALSSGLIMWIWIYAPQRLPREYNSWIRSVAQIDERLLQTMRMSFNGTLAYGRDTGHESPIKSLALELGLPEAVGDPAKTAPIPCEVFHCGTGKSCVWNAVERFALTWRFVIKMHLLLALASIARSGPSGASVRKAVVGAARSSTFLSAFVTTHIFTICLVRTHIGPRLVGKDNKPGLSWLDSGCAITCACAACGWSILLEHQSRRKEMALFVAPRALRAILPTTYDRKYLLREQLAFALSVSTILTAAHARPESVHGLFGSLLRRINT